MDKQYIADFQFVGSSVKSLNIKNNFVALGNEANASRNVEVSHAISNIEKINDDKTLTATVLLNISVKIESNGRVYEVDLTIEGCFNAPAEMGDETFTGMLQVNGVTTLYSLARAFIHSTTSQTLVAGSVLLPMFNVAAYSKDMNNKDE